MIRILVGWQRRAAKNCLPPLSWVEKKPLKLKQQSTGGIRRAGALGTAQGVIEVTPYALLFILVGRRLWTALDCHTALRDLKNNKKTLKQQSTTRGRRVRAEGGRSEAD